MMDPTSGVVSRPKSFNEGLRSASEHQSLREAAEDSSPPAMLPATQATAAGSAATAAGQIPGPFQSATSQYARNPSSRMITSASEPAISAAAQNGEPQRIRAQNSKIDTIKNWSISTYKCTKQLMFEKLGKTSRTVDTELEQRIEHLRELKRKYLQVLGLSRAFTSHFYHVIQTQQALSDVFSELAQKSPELQQEFLYNAETQRNLHKNGEILLSALNFFLSSVNTLCNKTIEDTILTIRQYENSRLEYDAYRSDLELMLQVPKTEANAAKIEESQHNFSLYKQAYEKLRDDVNIKLQFLDENRIKVMHKQLLLFHNAISAYFSGNQQSLEATIKQFCIKPLTPNSTKPSWLEQ